MTLNIALDLLQKCYEEIKATEQMTSFKVNAAIVQLEEVGFGFNDIHARAYAAPLSRAGGIRAARGVNLDLARGATATSQHPAGDLPYRGIRGVCWKCGSQDHAGWR